MAAKKPAAKTTKTPVKKSGGTAISGPSKNEMRKWEIESALSTLQRADQIRKDRKMMDDVKKLAQEQMNILKNIK